MREEIRSFEMIIWEKELLSTTLTWQLDETKNSLKMTEHEYKTKINQMSHEEKERQTLERREKSYLQKEMEEMEQKCLETEMKRRTEVEVCQWEYDWLQKENTMIKEEKHMLEIKLNDMQWELGDLWVRNASSTEEHGMIEKEFRKL